jgi:hypothetical protein
MAGIGGVSGTMQRRDMPASKGGNENSRIAHVRTMKKCRHRGVASRHLRE